jgi:cytochrome P450
VTSLDDNWIEHHFDPFSPELALDLHPTLKRARERCPFTQSDQHGGFWLATRYDDILRLAQDWETFSNELGITVPRMSAAGDPSSASAMKIYPVSIDPPLQRTFKRLINGYFTPAVVEQWEQPTRALVNRLIDGFVESGRCDFMAELARPFPGLAFFDLALHAPPDDLEQVNDWATMASLPDAGDSLLKLAGWIKDFVEQRRREGPRGDVVDGVMQADIEGRPIADDEVIGTIQLLILGGLETTAGVLGMSMLRFCEQPDIPAYLRAHPGRIPAAVEELLRLDGSFICIGRTARREVEVAGQTVAQYDPVLMYWASANRDEAEFERPEEFDVDRPRNRHLAFGAGTHRCAGSHLARMNLRIALEELLPRLHDLRLEDGTDIEYHSTFNRAPLSVPITFNPGTRASSPG